jgi:hypothetical protein
MRAPGFGVVAVVIPPRLLRASHIDATVRAQVRRCRAVASVCVTLRDRDGTTTEIPLAMPAIQIEGETMPREYADSIYYSAAETAKIIREELKAAFPHVKFSVRAENFAQGNAVRVHWENGPTEEAVRALTGDKYQSYLPDHGVRSIPLPGGKRAYYAKFITTSRRFS